MSKKLVTLAALSLVIAVLSSCAPSRQGLAYLRPLNKFASAAANVFVEEPSDSAFAKEIGSVLALYSDSVELKHQSKFLAPARTYLCHTTQSFCSHTGSKSPGPRAFVSPKGMFISPRLKDTPDWQAIVYHEMSHIILFQHLGIFRYRKTPVWFTEGLATYISNGGGSGNVTDQAAWDSLHQGKHFEPVDEEPLLFPKSFSNDNIGAWVQYRQAMLFVAFLHDHNEQAYVKLLNSVFAKKPFPKAVQEAYGMKVAELWNIFMEQEKHKRLVEDQPLAE